MALTYSNAFSAAAFPTILAQVQVAILANCAVVFAELTSVTNDTNRRNLAYAVVKNPTAYAVKFADYLLAKNTTTLSMDAGGASLTVSDAAVLAAVSGVWDELANSVASPIN